MSRTLIRSVAVIVLAVSVPGAFVQSVVASVGSPGRAPATMRDAEADASPTPSPIQTPTPAPAPSPTPTPVATPTPFDEGEAQITALSVIDEDGDLDTQHDRYAFAGRWEFAADFDRAEVLSAEPFSEGDDPAFWHIRYTEDVPILIIDVLPAFYALLDADCVTTDNAVEWGLTGTSIFGLLTGAGPVSFECTFIHTPSDFIPVGGSIDATAYIDPDADPSTSGFDFPTRPFEFAIELEDAEVVSAMPVSADGDPAFWEISYLAPSARVVVTEIPQEGLQLVRASCYDIWTDVRVPATLTGNSVSFEATAPTGDLEGQYGCNMVHVRTNATPQVTLPPTDIGREVTGQPSGWPPLLLPVLVAALSVVGLKLDRRRSSSRSQH